MFNGLRTNIFKIKKADLKKAKDWYAKLLGKKPYFDEPFYIGFNVGGFELGLQPAEEKIVLGNNVEVYWGVKNIEKVFAQCLKVGAVEAMPITNVGGDIKVATIHDPFGNIFGLIENPGFVIEG